MSDASNRRSDEFLKISGQFKLGALITESSHPITANLSEVARENVVQALDLLLQVDGDVVRKFREFVESRRAEQIAEAIVDAVRQGGKLFFTGCGATGRLSILLVSIWRDFWAKRNQSEWEHRAFSVMAGGDFALIKSVEGFEDFAAFGRKQLGDLGVSNRDVVFAITEGGETSFVIGTAWKGVEAGAKVYFVYNNPDDILCEHVERSREVIQDGRIEKINLTTGPMAITGSTRMQATTIQLCVVITILEMAVRRLSGESPGQTAEIPARFLKGLTELHANLRAPGLLNSLADLVKLEESVYCAGRKNSYFADGFGIDVLTDTTERSPTYCTPPFRRCDDPKAAESWSFLFLPQATTTDAWLSILKREPQCIEWTEAELLELVGPGRLQRTSETLRRITRGDLMTFRIGRDGLELRRPAAGDSAIGILAAAEAERLLGPGGFCHEQLEEARRAGAETGLILVGDGSPVLERPGLKTVRLPIPTNDFFLDGLSRVGLKMLLNALSTCTMVRLGRVMGNCMIWVVASNLKLIDRATRYIQRLTGLDYAAANRLLFETVEYIEPRMKADQAYPPVVGLAVLRARQGLSNEEAERRLAGSRV